MGGRGASLNVNNYLGWSHERRTSSYETIQTDGNTKFLMQKDGSRTSTPIFSNTKGRMYVTVNSQGKIASITQYDSNHKQVFSIHEPHSGHSVQEVHMHSSLETGRKETYWNDMPKKYRDLYRSIKQKYNDYDILNKVKGFNARYGR